MIDPQRKLVCVCRDLRRGCKRSGSVGPLGLIGQRIASQDGSDFGAYRDSQRIAGKSRGINPLSFGRCWHRKYLRRSKHLPKALILREIVSSAAPIINSRKHHWPAAGDAKLVASEGRNPPRIYCALMIEEISRVKRRVADKFESAAMHVIRAGFGDHIIKTCGSVTDFRT